MTERELFEALNYIRDLQRDYTVNTARFQLLWEWVLLNVDKPPEKFKDYFHESGVPKRPSQN